MSSAEIAHDTPPPAQPKARRRAATNGSPRTWVIVRVSAIRMGVAMWRGWVKGWRYTWTVYALVRLGLLWASFCGNTGLAKHRTRTDHRGRMRIKVYDVPRLCRFRVTPHGWTMRVRLRPGQHLQQYADVCEPLRHTARVQTVKALELPGQPGFLELRVLRRDPLRRVTEKPREFSPGRLCCGSTENGDPLVLDFVEQPHYLISGATGSGKSMLLSCVQAAIAPTDAAMGLLGSQIRAGGRGLAPALHRRGQHSARRACVVRAGAVAGRATRLHPA